MLSDPVPDCAGETVFADLAENPHLGKYPGDGDCAGCKQEYIFLFKFDVMELHYFYYTNSSDFKCEEMASYCRSCRNLFSVCSSVGFFLFLLWNGNGKRYVSGVL